MNGQILFTTVQNLVELANTDEYIPRDMDAIVRTIRILVDQINHSKWSLENGYEFVYYWYNYGGKVHEFYEINGKI